MGKGREQVAPNRLFGTVLEWRGTQGWIMPKETVDHPLASKRGGKLYVAADDTEEGTLEPGATVTFNVYKDPQGLGAFKCKVAGTFGGKDLGKTSKGKGKGAQQLGATLAVKGGGMALTPGSKADRMRVLPTRVSGTIKEKKPNQKFGWITPKVPIKHKLYTQRGLFYSATDVVPTTQEEKDQGKELEPGTEVTFFVYTDGKGIGAERIMEWKGSEFGPPTPKKAEKSSKGKGTGKGKGKQWGPIETAFAKEYVKTVQKASSKPTKKLPRKRVSEDSRLGKVVAWKGKFGWIEPDDPLDHPKANKNGHIYVREDDVLIGTLKAGQLVNFHVYEDASGLGAEECIEC